MSLIDTRRYFLTWSLWLTFFTVLFPGPGQLRADEDVVDRKAVQQVIRAQLNAFAVNDDERAFSYASTAIQQGFSSPRAFGDMVRRRYPAVYEAATVRFREQITHPDFLVQRVQLVGPDGLYWDAFYRMEQDGGEWRIGGVVLNEVAGGI